MKKSYLSILGIVMLFLFANQIKAQFSVTNCSDPQQTCAFESSCKPISFDTYGGGGDCPFQFCIEEQINCGTPKVPCQAQAPVCFEIRKGVVPPDNFCYTTLPSNLNCDCEVVATRITIKRIWENNNGTFATIVLDGQNASNFINFLSGNGGSSFVAYGGLNICSSGANGFVKFHRLSFNMDAAGNISFLADVLLGL